MDYSLFNRSIEKELLPTARELDIDVVAFGLLAHGLLNGSWTKERVNALETSSFAPTGLFQRDNLRKNIELIDSLEEIAKEKKPVFPN